MNASSSENEVTRLLNALHDDVAGNSAAERLLTCIYDELRRLAHYKMAVEAPGHTLQPTALVHEAWLRIVAPGHQTWQNRAHFFGAASEAMRRILVEHARRRNSLKRRGDAHPEELNESSFLVTAPPDELLAVDEALEKLKVVDPVAAELVKLRYFVGLTMEEAAEALNMAPRSTERLWTFARVWLKREIGR